MQAFVHALYNELSLIRIKKIQFSLIRKENSSAIPSNINIVQLITN